MSRSWRRGRLRVAHGIRKSRFSSALRYVVLPMPSPFVACGVRDDFFSIRSDSSTVPRQRFQHLPFKLLQPQRHRLRTRLLFFLLFQPNRTLNSRRSRNRHWRASSRHVSCGRGRINLRRAPTKSHNGNAGNADETCYGRRSVAEIC